MQTNNRDQTFGFTFSVKIRMLIIKMFCWVYEKNLWDTLIRTQNRITLIGTLTSPVAKNVCLPAISMDLCGQPIIVTNTDTFSAK